MKTIRQIIKSKSGFVTVTIAAMMVALVGMAALATDVGVLYVNHNQLENMTDSGALAGALEYFFDQSQAVSVAKGYAMQNGKAGDLINAWVDTDEMKVVVTASRDVGLFFARVLDKDSAQVSTISAAKIANASGMSSLCPFGIVSDAFAVGDSYTLKVDVQNKYKGNFHCVDLPLKTDDGKTTGANVLYYNILNGSGGVKVDQLIATETGGMVGPIGKSLEQRLNISTIIIVPVLKPGAWEGDGGKHDVQIVGFAAFDVDKSASNGHEVTGTFVQMVTAADILSEDQNNNYGVFGTKLVTP